MNRLPRSSDGLKSGWKCPECEAVLAPHISCCVNCKGEEEPTSGVPPRNPWIEHIATEDGAEWYYTMTPAPCPHDFPDVDVVYVPPRREEEK